MIIALILFALCLGFIFIYSLVQLFLVISYWQKNKEDLPPKLDSFPFVTIQLPIYNEFYVVERLLTAISKIDYPKDKFEIQLLDDSTDETVHVSARIIESLADKNYHVRHIRRKNRKGYKAGALTEGTKVAKGEFIAIFDADFIPDPSFLMRSIPYFKNKKVGVVQTKWGYINEDYSTLTKMQAFGLNAHFSIEQVGRNNAHHFINFNGTAGIWRKSCIEAAGGWEADTLTEDLDLSYRAQLIGWEFKYLENVESPSELPVEINALKAQQFRWNKGAASCVKKNLGKVWKNKKIGLKTKFHATFHLMNSTIFLAILLMSILTIPVIVIKPLLPEFKHLFQWSGMLAISWIILGLFYLTSYLNTKKKGESPVHFLWKFPLFLSISMGLSLHNAIAVLEGYLGRKTPFVRTPKFNIEKEGNWVKNIYNVKKISPITVLEGVLLLYFIYAFSLALSYNDFGIMPLILFLIFGYGFVFINSIFHWKKVFKGVTYDALGK